VTDLLIEIPEFNITLTPGCRVKLGRFDIITWILSYGWYSWGGNREVCGWYLTNIKDVSDLKPLYRTDLDDIYLIET